MVELIGHCSGWSPKKCKVFVQSSLKNQPKWTFKIVCMKCILIQWKLKSVLPTLYHFKSTRSGIYLVVKGLGFIPVKWVISFMSFIIIIFFIFRKFEEITSYPFRAVTHNPLLSNWSMLVAYIMKYISPDRLCRVYIWVTSNFFPIFNKFIKATLSKFWYERDLIILGWLMSFLLLCTTKINEWSLKPRWWTLWAEIISGCETKAHLNVTHLFESIFSAVLSVNASFLTNCQLIFLG